MAIVDDVAATVGTVSGPAPRPDFDEHPAAPDCADVGHEYGQKPLTTLVDVLDEIVKLLADAYTLDMQLADNDNCRAARSG